jgi:SNF2 family DNA or RNA helicase
VSINFKNAAEQQAYNKLVEDLIAGLNTRKGQDRDSYVHFLVEMQKMQQGAELLRCDHIADRVMANTAEKAVIVASNFVDTLRKTYRILTTERGISPDRIAFIVGGQKMEERQKMVDEFQRGKRDILLFTMRSGGVGISLHHDRPETKPRHIILPPTWSAIDLVQALGRAHRLTSLSATTQEILWYANTIEDAVRIKVELKLKCISKAVTAKEQFVDTFVKQIDEQIDAEKLVETSEQVKHENDNTENDDVDSASEDDSLTGEGLDS